MKRSGPTNYQLKLLLAELESKAAKNKFWRRIVHDLRKPSRQRRIVNVYKIDRFAREGEMVAVPGKVLSAGELNKKVDVAAVNFSHEAKRKVIDAKGKTLSLRELFEQNPEGKKVRILG